jgi:hypothetical protein
MTTPTTDSGFHLGVQEGDNEPGSVSATAAEMGEKPPATGLAQVTVTTDAVHVASLTIHDPDVVAAAQVSADPGRTILEMLATGARVLKFASATMDARMLERTVSDLENAFQSRMDATVATLDAKTQALLDPETGSIPSTLHEVREEIAKRLSDTFDPELTTSALSIIDNTLSKHKDAINQDVRRLLDPSLTDSPLHGLESRLKELAREQAKELRETAEKIKEALVAEQARQEVIAKTTSKGFTYEDMVEQAVERIATVHGDYCCNVGRESGSAGTAKGDLLVSLSADDCAGQSLRFVLECKDQHLSKNQVKAELAAAMENRDAAAGVLVFAGDEASPYHVPFAYSGDQAIVVYDRDKPDDQVLRVAYAWARWTARRSQTPNDELDAEAILAALHDAEAGLAKKAQVLTGLTHADNGIAAARRAVDALADQVSDALERIRTALDP